MISVVVLDPDSHSDERAQEIVVRSLGWLVSAVVAGVVRDVTLAVSPAADLARIAEQAGCAIVQASDEADRLAAAVAKARCDRVLVIRVGYRPLGPLIEEIDMFDRAAGRTDAALLLAAPRTLLQRLFPGSAPVVGLLAPREHFACTRASFRTFSRSLRRANRLDSRALPLT